MAFLSRREGKIFFHVLGAPPKQSAVSTKGKKPFSKNNPPTILMLRGLGRSSRYWLGFDKIMAKHFQVVTMDPRGVGRTTQPMGWNDSIDDLADDCLAILDQIEAERFHVFGLSFGGMVGSAIAAKAPDRVQSLIIAASSSSDYRAFRVSATLLPKLLFALRQGRFQDALLAAVVPAHVLRSWGPEIQAAWQDILRAEGFPLITTLKQLRAAASHSLRGKFEDAEFPILFMHGSMDELCPIRNSQELNKVVPGSLLKVIKGAGHEIALGFEEDVSRIIREFALGKKVVKERA
ncbi:MAG: alpha/beta hydrolase [Proteobacteria bacterium]|nr:MAG: alpha/beta hydrolase [Pseudomonadota bacterium]